MSKENKNSHAPLSGVVARLKCVLSFAAIFVGAILLCIPFGAWWIITGNDLLKWWVKTLIPSDF